MSLIIRLLSLIAISVLVSSCFKEDEKVPPHEPGNTLTDTVELTSLYTFQVYYNLSSASAVKINARNLWDLSFDCTPEGWNIRLNTSCFMVAAVLSDQEFGLPADTTGAIWKYDNSGGNKDSTAIGKWFSITDADTLSDGKVYMINRGLDENGLHRGYKQLRIDSLVNGTYYFQTANYDGSGQQSFQVTKDTALNYVEFSFDHHSVSEPLKEQWDLLFTQYTTLLFTDEGEPYPYLVTGVLLNPYRVEVASDTLHSFEAISYNQVKDLVFTTRQDRIGYDWKSYDFASGAYTVNIGQVYIIHDTQGFYYKLRFLGFYNEKGDKGYPSFEFQRL
jgi:hypothetical protein